MCFKLTYFSGPVGHLEDMSVTVNPFEDKEWAEITPEVVQRFFSSKIKIYYLIFFFSF